MALCYQVPMKELGQLQAPICQLQVPMKMVLYMLNYTEPHSTLQISSKMRLMTFECIIATCSSPLSLMPAIKESFKWEGTSGGL